MAEWTPGPWMATKSDPAEGYDVWWINSTVAALEICSTPGYFGNGDRDEAEANTHLISAAPELYDALVNAMTLVNAFTGPDDSIANAIRAVSAAALAVARGEEKTDG